ncbi:unnamed protein product [Merluccius merluccius]
MSVGTESSGFSSEEVLSHRFPLHRACRDGDVAALCALLRGCGGGGAADRAALAAEDSFYGWTPIHWAAHFGKLECVMRLVQVGCGVNAVTSRFAQTPTHIAAFGGHPDCLLWLLQTGADIKRQDYVGEAPIHKAARAGSLECVRALLMQGAEADLRNASGLTAADLAHAQGFRECAEVLFNAQNLQRNLAPSQGQLSGFCLNGTALNGDNSLPTLQGRSFLNGAPNRKRSFDGMEANQIKKPRTNGMLLATLRNASGLTAADLAHAQGFRECAEVLFNAQNLQRNLAPSQGQLSGFCLNGTALNGDNSLPTLQGRSFLNGAPNRKRSFDGMEANQIKKPRTNGETHCGDISSNGHSQQELPNGEPTPENIYCHHLVYRDMSETITHNTAGSQLEHQRSVKAEQFYDHAFFSTMLLYNGS